MLANDLLCFSHLRWDFVYQRPNHLMARCARERRVLFIEEPIFDTGSAQLQQIALTDNLCRIIPHLPEQLAPAARVAAVRDMIATLCKELDIQRAIHWFYTPMMLPLAEGLTASLTVYDCMDELSNFAFAPPELHARERALMAKAELMFTGGMALYEAKRAQHRNVHGVPSSVDTAFFARARPAQPVPTDLASIPAPRVGYCGVLDERLDLALVEATARAHPEWQLIFIGPLAKIGPEHLPQLPNLHYLGAKPYAQLPSYLASCQVAIMPFALNDATRFISPTKTPEYLAAGLPVVSTAIVDVVEPYERLGLVAIGRSAQDFIQHIERKLLAHDERPGERDAFLATISWEETWSRMRTLMRRTQSEKQKERIARASHAPSGEARDANEVNHV